MKTYPQLKREILKDNKIKSAYNALGPEFEVITTLIKRRLEAKGKNSFALWKTF